MVLMLEDPENLSLKEKASLLKVSCICFLNLGGSEYVLISVQRSFLGRKMNYIAMTSHKYQASEMLSINISKKTGIDRCQ